MSIRSDMQQDMIKQISDRIPGIKDRLESEEATKQSLVLPFLQALNYNIFDPYEVNPEFKADIGIKNNEKVDYAIMSNDIPVILIECKPANIALGNSKQYTQIYRYFNATPAKIGIITNGVEYRFYSDLDEPNKMDDTPFLQINLADFNVNLVDHLRKFVKGFDVEEAIESASNIRYTNKMKAVILQQYYDPEDDFVEWLGRRVYSGRITQQARNKLARLARRAFHEVMSDHVSATLKTAQDLSLIPLDEVDIDESEMLLEDSRGIVTTAEEIEGHEIIKDILKDILQPERIVMRDNKSYCAIVVDNNSRKQLCRFYFDGAVKRIAVFDGSVSEHGSQVETKYDVEEIRDIYEHSSIIQMTASRYL